MTKTEQIKQRVVDRLLDNLKEYIINYRNEFYAIVKAKNQEEAINQFKRGNVDYELNGDLWDDFIECEET